MTAPEIRNGLNDYIKSATERLAHALAMLQRDPSDTPEEAEAARCEGMDALEEAFVSFNALLSDEDAQTFDKIYPDGQRSKTTGDWMRDDERRRQRLLR